VSFRKTLSAVIAPFARLSTTTVLLFFNGNVKLLDPSYEFNLGDQLALRSLGAIVLTAAADTSSGWQELGFNMHHPIFGTGLGTPLGMSDPSKAAFAALMVRKAISFLIPRQIIAITIMNGGGVPGITQFSPAYGLYSNPSVNADPFDPAQALTFLHQAGC